MSAITHTPRAGLEGLTPAELDRIAPRADDLACRDRFYEEVCENLHASRATSGEIWAPASRTHGFPRKAAIGPLDASVLNA